MLPLLFFYQLIRSFQQTGPIILKDLDMILLQVSQFPESDTIEYFRSDQVFFLAFPLLFHSRIDGFYHLSPFSGIHDEFIPIFCSTMAPDRFFARVDRVSTPASANT